MTNFMLMVTKWCNDLWANLFRMTSNFHDVCCSCEQTLSLELWFRAEFNNFLVVLTQISSLITTKAVKVLWMLFLMIIYQQTKPLSEALTLDQNLWLGRVSFTSSSPLETTWSPPNIVSWCIDSGLMIKHFSVAISNESVYQ